ncbi:MAG TPA: condensation domain-containing protein, partial [Pyrinomonadaceae bacterium]
MSAPTIVEGFRLSPQQRRLWMLQQDDESSFCSQLVLLLEGELQIDDLRAALKQVCARHESLRSTLTCLPGVVMPILAVVDDLDISWRTVDLCGELEEALAAERQREFDLEYGPLVHATLYALSPARHVLSIAVPALCADKRTLSNLFTELCQCYASAIEGEDEPFQYLQFAEWQNTLTGEPEAKDGKEYWGKQELSAAASVRLPGQRRTGNERRSAMQSLKMSLPSEMAAHIAAFAERYDATRVNVLLAVWQTLLWRLTRRPIIVGNVCEGRSYELLSAAFGLFARALPVHCRFEDGLSFAEVVAHIATLQHEATEWQDYFELGQAADGTSNYFTFGYEYTELPAARNERGVQFSIFHQHCGVERFRLKLSSISNEELEFEYDDTAFIETHVRHLAGQFQTLLAAALANPEEQVDDYDIVSNAEREQILFTWNQTQRDYALDHCLHQLFEEQVKRTPDAAAVVFKDSQLTFHELNQRANQLAHYLQAHGVGPEIPVGLCFERSLEMIVGLL